MRFWEIRAIIHGHHHRHADILNMIRNHGYWVLSSVCGKSFSDSMTPTDLIPFEWDEQPEPVEMSDDEYQRLKAAIEAENKKD